MTQISSGIAWAILCVKRLSSLIVKQSAIINAINILMTKLLKSLINISHRKLLSPARSRIFLVRRASATGDNERTIDGFSIDTNRRGRISLESPAISILRFCLANALRLDDQHPSTNSPSLAHYRSAFDSIHGMFSFYFFVFMHDVVCARLAPDSVSLLIGLSGGNSSFF